VVYVSLSSCALPHGRVRQALGNETEVDLGTLKIPSATTTWIDGGLLYTHMPFLGKGEDWVMGGG